MRALPAVLLCVLLASTASGQTVGSTHATLEAAPPAEAIAPLTGLARVPVLLRVSCPPSPDGVTATFRLLQAPPWARAEVEPEVVRVDGSACLQREVLVQTTVEVRATEQAPAFQPAAIELEAAVQAPLSAPAYARAAFPVTAGYYAVLDVARPREILTPDADGLASVTLRVTNFGNGPTRVLFEAGAVARDLAVAPPAPLVLSGRTDGSPTNRADVQLRVQRLEPGEAPSVFTLRYRSAYALDPGLPGDHGEMAFQVLPWATPDGEPLGAAALAEGQRDLPFGALLLVGTGLAAAALLRRR